MSQDTTTILIVDDSKYNLQILSTMLSNQGYKVLEANNGSSAIAIARNSDVQLILLDIKMPEMNGYEVCKILKKSTLTQNIPIVFISAIDNVEEKVEAFSVGGVDFINKPFHLVEVLARVETHLRLNSLQKQLLEQTKLLESQNNILREQISNLTGVDWGLYSEIKEGFSLKQMRLFYQPIVNLEINKTTGFEALIRWKHPQRGLISPIDFIGVIENTDLVYEAGRWVLDTACKQLRDWQQSCPSNANLTISVNVSTKQLAEPNLAAYIRHLLNIYQVNPSCLKLEITESTVMGDRDLTLVFLHQLKEIGIQFCIDDFGTGYSSLRRLVDFPIDILKIDRSFISNEDWIIVKAIGSLAFSLGKEIVVEGIETTSELSILKTLFQSSLANCYGQGYLFAKPLESDLAFDFLTHN
ncbi:EAL domain-containing response regulator [Pseudanabaena biceps]|nr:EAL domain-containing response regulator [Pseudanabaena biceps]